MNGLEDEMKSALKSVLLLLFLAQYACASYPTNANSSGPGNSNSAVGRNDEKGQTIHWDKQGITLTLPLDWRKDDSLSREDEKRNDTFSTSSLLWRSPRDQRIEFNIETGETDFPASEGEMLDKDYQSNKSRAAIKDLHYQDLGGVKGLYYRTDSGDENRIMGYWLTYRHYRGKAQSIGVNIVGDRTEMALLMSILNSIRLERD
jgi:hypothetical protein